MHFADSIILFFSKILVDFPCGWEILNVKLTTSHFVLKQFDHIVIGARPRHLALKCQNITTLYIYKKAVKMLNIYLMNFLNFSRWREAPKRFNTLSSHERFEGECLAPLLYRKKERKNAPLLVEKKKALLAKRKSTSPSSSSSSDSVMRTPTLSKAPRRSFLSIVPS